MSDVSFLFLFMGIFSRISLGMKYAVARLSFFFWFCTFMFKMYVEWKMDVKA